MHLIRMLHKLAPGQVKALMLAGWMRARRVHFNTKKLMIWPETIAGYGGWPLVNSDRDLGYNRRKIGRLSLTCPRLGCLNHQDVTSSQLRNAVRWKLILCTHCGRRSTASKWTCSCDIKWTVCPIHRRPGLECGVAQKRGSVLKTRPRRGNRRRKPSIAQRRYGAKRSVRQAFGQSPYQCDYFEAETGRLIPLSMEMLNQRHPILANKIRRLSRQCEGDG